MTKIRELLDDTKVLENYGDYFEQMKNFAYVVIYLLQLLFCFLIIGAIIVCIYGIVEDGFLSLFKQNFKFIVFIIVPTASALIIEYLKNETPLKDWKPVGF